VKRENPISYFARTNTRATYRPFGIKRDDRFAHIYVLGRTGTGKTTLLETLALQDIHAGRGICVLDPHGDFSERLRRAIPPHRERDLIWFNAPDPIQPYGFNPLRKVAPHLVPLAASGLLDAFRKIWGEKAWGVRMEHFLRNALFALLEYGDATLPDVLRIFGDQKYRKVVLARITNVQVRAFWLEEYPRLNPRYRQESLGPIQNKLGALLADPRLHRILTKPQADVRLRLVMDSQKILLVNLAQGSLGGDTARLLGALLISNIALAAFSRIDTPEARRKDFHVFADEFQTFTSLSVVEMISGLRKFRTGMVLASQSLTSLEPEIRHAVLANSATTICFRLGAEDAMTVSREFMPTFMPEDLIGLPNHTIYLRLLIDGTPSAAFSATTMTPQEALRWISATTPKTELTAGGAMEHL
jgi:energy-coupling factor transporter ATP-binding protein EcfA2